MNYCLGEHFLSSLENLGQYQKLIVRRNITYSRELVIYIYRYYILADVLSYFPQVRPQ